MRKILIFPAVALLAAPGRAAGQEPDCGSFQASITGADTREVQGGMATLRTLDDRPFTHIDLRAAVPGADSVLVLSFSRHSAMPAAGDYAISSAAASEQTFSGSYLRVRRAGGIVSYNGDSGTMILSAVENGRVRGDFELAGAALDDSAARVRVRGTFTALVGHQAEACQFAAGRVGAPAGLPGAPLLAGRGPLQRRPPAADSTPRRPPTPDEAPFGLRMGTKLSELLRLGLTPRDMDLGIYQLARVPQPREGFRDFLVMVSFAEGLCRVTALGRPVASGGDGAALKAAFDRMEASLRATYGPGRRMDYQTDEGKLHPRSWMAALQRKERKLSTFWLADAGSTLPPALRGIEMEASATSATSGFVAVHYEFANFPVCQREAQRRRPPAP